MSLLHSLISFRRGINEPISDTVTRFEIVHQLAASQDGFSMTITAISMFLIKVVGADLLETHDLLQPFDHWPNTLLEFEMLKLALRGIPHPGMIHARLPLRGPRLDYVQISRASLQGRHLENLATGTDFPVIYKIGDVVHYRRIGPLGEPRWIGPHIVTCVTNMAQGEITIQCRSQSTVVRVRDIRRHKRNYAISV